MPMPRWLSALLVAALLLSSAPVSALAAPLAPLPQQQAPSAANASSYLFSVTPPVVNALPQVGGFDAAGFVNIEHARHYAQVQAQLDALLAQGAISGYSAQPAAFAFTLKGVTAAALAALGSLGVLQPGGEMSAASVDELAAAYGRQLNAAIDGSVHQAAPEQAAPAQGADSLPPPLPPVPGDKERRTAALLTAADDPAAIAVAPQFSVYLNNDYVVGHNLGQGILVTLTLKSAGGLVKGTATTGTSSNGDVILGPVDVYGNRVMIVAGDVVEVQTPDLITIPVVDLQVIPNVSARQITGKAPANITNTEGSILPHLVVEPAGYVTTTAAGAFTVSNITLALGDYWWIEYANEQGHRTILSYGVPVISARGYLAPWSSSYYGESYVGGSVVAVNTPVTVTLERAGHAPIVNFVVSDNAGRFGVILHDQYGNEAPILAGDSLQATDGVLTSAVVVPAFNVRSDPDADTLSGTTDAMVVTDSVRLPQSLSLWPTSTSDYSYGRTVLAPGGVFSAGNPFYFRADAGSSADDEDWGPGQQGHLRYLDAEGDAVFDDFRAPAAKPIITLRSLGTGYGISYGENVVSGVTSGPCTYGTVTLLDAANVVKDQNVVSACYSFTTEFKDAYGNALPILPGDTVEATFNEGTTRVKAPNLNLSANAEMDVVSGQIDAGLVTTTTFQSPMSLAVLAFDSYYLYSWAHNVQPDAAGVFSVYMGDFRDIRPGNRGLATYIDAEGNSVFALWQAPFPQPRFSLRGGIGYVADNYLFITIPDYYCTLEGMSVQVKAPDNSIRWQTTQSFCGGVSFYLYDDFGNAIDLNAGDVVEATSNGQSTSVTIPSFDNIVSDPETDTVSGITNAQVTTTTIGMPPSLTVWPMSHGTYGYGKQVEVAAGGAFKAANPFYWNGNPYFGSTTVDWDAGQRGHLHYIDANSNDVFASFVAMTDQPLLSINKGGNTVSGMLLAADAPVTLTLQSGSTVKAAGYATSDLYGEFDVSFYDGGGNPQEIAEGDQVVLAEPAVTVNVPPLTAQVDTDNEQVAGKAPASSLLNVYQPTSPLQLPSTSSDAAGNYQADFRGKADLTASSLVKVDYQSPEGHTIWIERLGGVMLSAALNTGRVWGYAPVEDAIPIVVTVKRGGAVIGVDSLNASAYFSAFPIDASGKPIILAAGDVVELDFGAGVVRTLTLTALNMTIDAGADSVAGSGPPLRRLSLLVNAWPQPYDETVVADAAGAWSVDLTTEGGDIQPGNMAAVRYSTDGIDTTWLFGVSPVFYVRQLADNMVQGQAAPYAPVTVTLKRSGIDLATVYNEADGSGNFSAYLRDVNGLSAPIREGDVVEVKSTQTVSVTIPVLKLFVDTAAQIVSGVGPANTTLGLSTNAGNRTVKTDASGAFATLFVTPYGLYSARLSYREPGGNWIMANVAQQTGGVAYLAARWDANEWEYRSNAVSGSTGAGPRAVDLMLRRGGGAVAAATAWASTGGSFNTQFLDSASQPVGILPGDVIEMVSGDVSRSMTVPALTVQTNEESNTLFGTGPANTQLNSDWWGSTLIDPTGAWVLGYEDVLEAGDWGTIHVTDLLGNHTYLGWSIAAVTVRQNSNYLYGRAPLGADVQVQLQRGAAIVAATSVEADASNGWFNAEFFGDGGSPAIIQPNDVVLVDAGKPITVPVGPLSAAVDVAADKVTGTGPAGEELFVYGWTVGDGVTRLVTAAGDGGYAADFSGALDLRAGSWVDVAYANADGNRVWMGWYAPLVRINLAADIVDGFATPNSMASLVLKRGGAVVAAAEALTSMNGNFSAFFLDGSGSVIDLVAGDVVEVTASPTVAAAAIALTASLDPRTDKVTGSAPAGTALLVIAYRCTASGCSSWEKTAVVGADGAYTADFGGSFDLDQTSYAYVQASDAGGNQTSIATQPAEAPLLQSAEEAVAAAGATLLMSGAGLGNGGNVTPPMLVNVVGGGQLVFRSNGGRLVITAPDGAITRVSGSSFIVQNAGPGIWKVQVQIEDGIGVQYAAAVGQSLYSIYMPSVKR